MKNVLVVSNYNAGRKKAVMYKKLLHKFLLRNSENFKFITIDELDEINRGDYDVIFAMGGDGTVNKVIPYIINTDKTLGIIPAGTANLLAANLGLSTKLKNTLNIIKKGNTKKIDIIDINGNYCALRCGLGYDSDIICKTTQNLKNKFGYFAYFIAGIIFALRLKKREYNMVIDDEPYKIKASGIIFANAANMYRNIVSLANNSKLDDGYMDIFVLKTTNPIVFFFEFLNIILGIRKSSKRAQYIHANNITIESNWLACHIDGEKKNLKDEIKMSVCSKQINVFCK